MKGLVLNAIVLALGLIILGNGSNPGGQGNKDESLIAKLSLLGRNRTKNLQTTPTQKFNRKISRNMNHLDKN